MNTLQSCCLDAMLTAKIRFCSSLMQMGTKVSWLLALVLILEETTGLVGRVHDSQEEGRKEGPQ